MIRESKTFVTLLVFMFTSIFLIGCEYKKSSDEGFRVNLYMNDTVTTDSVGLYVWDDVYGKTCLLRNAKIQGNHAVLTGIVNNDRIAYIKTTDETNEIVYFILTNDSIFIDLRTSNPIIKGGDLNDKYSFYLKKRQDIKCKMDEILLNYLIMSADSSSTVSYEKNAVLDYKHWNDSLQMLYTEILNDDILIRNIFVTQYGNEVDSDLFNLTASENKKKE